MSKKGQPEKRSYSEVVESSFGDEITMINKQLEQMNSDIKETRESVQSLLNIEELKAFIVSTVEAISIEIEKRLVITIGKQMEEKFKEKNDELHQRLDMLVYENVQMKEQIEDLTSRLCESEKKKKKKKKNNKKKKKKTTTKKQKNSKTALQKSNINKQYSRKHNIKIMGVEEVENETEQSLTEQVITIVASKTKVNLDEHKITALHRIPGKTGMPKPVLINLKNNSVKTQIMKKRQELKRAGYRLVDDVTKQNTSLINRLMLHEKIDRAWYFNSSVYAKTTAGKRHKFDICSDIDKVIETEEKLRNRETLPCVHAHGSI